jgi:hypothetical protein
VQSDSVRREIAGSIKKREETVSEAARRLTEAIRDFVPGYGSSIRTVVSEAFDYMERSLRHVDPGLPPCTGRLKAIGASVSRP